MFILLQSINNNERKEWSWMPLLVLIHTVNLIKF